MYPGCPVWPCIREKGHDFCFECPEFPCDKVDGTPELKAKWEKANKRMQEISNAVKEGAMLTAALRALDRLGRLPDVDWLLGRINSASPASRLEIVPYLRDVDDAEQVLLKLIHMEGSSDVAVAAARVLGDVGTLLAVMPLNELRTRVWNDEAKRAVGDAIAAIQARQGSAVSGGLPPRSHSPAPNSAQRGW